MPAEKYPPFPSPEDIKRELLWERQAQEINAWNAWRGSPECRKTWEGKAMRGKNKSAGFMRSVEEEKSMRDRGLNPEGEGE